MRAPLIISLILSLFTGYLWADMTIRYDSITPSHKKPANELLIKKNLVRMNQITGNRPDVMVDLSTGDIVQLHSKSQSYFKINAQTLNQYVSLYRENKGLMQSLLSQGLKHLDQQKQGQVQQMIDKYERKSSSPSSISFKKTGKTDHILGVQCQVFALIDQGKHKSDVCLSSYQQLELSPSDIQSFEKLKKLVQQFKHSSPKQQDMLSLVVNGLENINGIPMKIIHYYPNGKIRNIIQAGSISLREVPEIAYRIPQDYQQKLTPLL